MHQTYDKEKCPYICNRPTNVNAKNCNVLWRNLISSYNNNNTYESKDKVCNYASVLCF